MQIRRGSAPDPKIVDIELDEFPGPQPDFPFSDRDNALASVCKRFEYASLVGTCRQPEMLFKRLTRDRAFDIAALTRQTEYDRASVCRYVRREINNIHANPHRICPQHRCVARRRNSCTVQ
jgi:hypothetical protein